MLPECMARQRQQGIALHRPGLEPAMTLAQHDLLAFGVLQIDELLFVAPEGDVEAEDALPEGETGGELGDMQLGYDVDPAAVWWGVPFAAHTEIFHRKR